MSKITILQVLYSGLGGHGSVSQSFIEADKDNEFTHQLFFYGIEEVKKDYLDFCNENQLQFTFEKKKWGFLSWLNIYKKLRQLQPDILLLHSTTTILPCKLYAILKRKKIIVIDHQANEKKRLQDWMYAYLNAFLAKKYVVLTKLSEQGLIRKIPYIKDKICIVENGINLSKFKPVRYSGKEINLTMISRINPLRDFETLIKAFDAVSKRYPTLNLFVAGDGPDMEKVKRLREQAMAKDQVFLLGQINEKEVIDLFHKTSIYIQSSLADNMSTSIMQAMACEIPVIATDIPGINNMIKQRSDGLLFECKNSAHLAELICELIEDKILYEKLSQAAGEKAIKHFSNLVMFAKYKNLIQTL